MEVVASLSQGRTAGAQCDLFTHKSVPVIFEPPCNTNQAVVILRIKIYSQSVFYFFVFGATTPPVGQGLLINEVSRSTVGRTPLEE